MSRVLRHIDGLNLSNSCLYCLLVLDYTPLYRSIYLRGIPLEGLPMIFCRQPGRSWRVFWVCGEGGVDQAGSYDESLDESCLGVRPGHPLRVIPVVGACEMRRSRGGVSLWDEAPGWRCSRGTGHWLAHVKISCLVPLRTGMSREQDHRTLCARHSFLNGRGTNAD